MNYWNFSNLFRYICCMCAHHQVFSNLLSFWCVMKWCINQNNLTFFGYPNIRPRQIHKYIRTKKKSRVWCIILSEDQRYMCALIRRKLLSENTFGLLVCVSRSGLIGSTENSLKTLIIYKLSEWLIKFLSTIRWE